MKFLNRLLATGLYTGNIPGAPGTYGSILALLLLLIFPFLNNIYFVILISILGIIISTYEEKITGLEDEPAIVIDEMAGIFISFLGVSLNIWVGVLGFILFRFFDIKKPFIIDKAQQIPGGWGVMADDILAGVFTRLIILIILFIGG